MTGPFAVAERQVKVWPVRLRSDDMVLGLAESVLSPEEKATADRRLPALRSDYILSRACLRMLLGAYLALPPIQVEYELGQFGKPRLTTVARSLHFSVSHSKGVAVYAFTPHCEVGVDIEQIRPFPDMHSIASRYFCREEAAALAALPVQEQEAAFFRCWTRKEAFIKAEGGGLSIPLDSFQVTLGPNEPAALVHIRQNRRAASDWTLVDMALVPGYASALAYRGKMQSMDIREVSDAQELGQKFLPKVV